MVNSVGILALQGDFLEHEEKIRSINPDIKIVRIKYVEQLNEIDRLILPGGESTTMNLLADHSEAKEKLFVALKQKVQEGLPVLATCAGIILLAKKILSFPENSSLQPFLELLPIKVLRNHYGRQQYSFETSLSLKGDPVPFQGIFIRAPIIETILENPDVEILSSFQNSPVMVKYNNIIGTTFHPELVKDSRIHELFLSL